MTHRHDDLQPEIFFVLNGLLNGNDGEFAHNFSGEQLRDGWYFLFNEIEEEGIGPYKSRDAAVKNAREYLAEMLEALEPDERL